MTELKNNNSPFTELFSLLRLQSLISGASVIDSGVSDTLIPIYDHANNAIDLMLKGLQGLGQLVGVTAQANQETLEEISDIGFFISGVSNLIEALGFLRQDVTEALKPALFPR